MWSLLLKFFWAKVKCLPLIHHWWHADDKGKVHHRTLYWVHRLKSKCHCAKVYTRIDYTVRLNCLIWHTVGTHTHPFSRFQPNKKIFSYFFKDSFNRISYKYKRIPPPLFFLQRCIYFLGGRVASQRFGGNKENGVVFLQAGPISFLCRRAKDIARRCNETWRQGYDSCCLCVATYKRILLLRFHSTSAVIPSTFSCWLSLFSFSFFLFNRPLLHHSLAVGTNAPLHSRGVFDFFLSVGGASFGSSVVDKLFSTS